MRRQGERGEREEREDSHAESSCTSVREKGKGKKEESKGEEDEGDEGRREGGHTHCVAWLWQLLCPSVASEFQSPWKKRRRRDSIKQHYQGRRTTQHHA